jgi:hypothetical protein
MAKRTKEPKSAISKITLRHERAFGHRVVFADGALLQTQKGDVLITFFCDGAPVQSETAELKMGPAGSRQLRPLGDFSQEFVRSHEVTVRMRPEAAASLITALLTRISNESPELLKKSGLEVHAVGAQ